MSVQNDKKAFKKQLIGKLYRLGFQIKEDKVLEDILAEEPFQDKDEIDLRELLKFILHNMYKYPFLVKNTINLRETIASIGFELEEYKEDFIDMYVNGSNEVLTVRKVNDEEYKKEAEFITSLSDKGIYVSLRKNAPVISNMDDLINCLKDYDNKKTLTLASKSSFEVYKEFGREMIENPEIEELIVSKISIDAFRKNGMKKSVNIKKFEYKYGIKICSFDGEIDSDKLENLTEKDLFELIIKEKIGVKISDISKYDHMLRKSKEMPEEVKVIFKEKKQEREKILKQLIKEKKEGKSEIPEDKNKKDTINSENDSEKESVKQEVKKESSERTRKKTTYECSQLITRFNELEEKISEKRNAYVNAVWEGIGGEEKSTRRDRSSVSDSLYAELVSLGKEEVKKRVEFGSKYQQIVQEIKKLEKEAQSLREKIDNPEDKKESNLILPDEYYRMDAGEQLRWWRSEASIPYREKTKEQLEQIQLELAKTLERKEREIIEKINEYFSFTGDIDNPESDIRKFMSFESKKQLVEELDKKNGRARQKAKTTKIEK